MSGGTRKSQTFSKNCDCSMYNGQIHVVRNPRDWARHLALKANDLLRATRSRQRELPTQCSFDVSDRDLPEQGFLDDASIGDLSEHEAIRGGLPEREFSDVSDQELPEQGFPDETIAEELSEHEAIRGGLPEQRVSDVSDWELPEQGFLDDISAGELSEHEAIRGGLPEETVSDISDREMPEQDASDDTSVGELSEQEAIRGGLPEETVSDVSDRELPERDVDADARALEGPVRGPPEQGLSEDEKLPGPDGNVSESNDSPDFAGNLSDSMDGNTMFDKHDQLDLLDEPLSSGVESLLGFIQLEDEDTSSSSSEKSGPVGQIQRGYAGPVDVEAGEWGSNDDGSSGDDMLEGIQESDVSDFDYKHPFGEPPTKPEMLSYALQDINLKHHIAREAAGDIRDLFGSVLPQKLLDYRTARKRIEKKTGIKEIQYDCCPHSHMSYSMYPDLEECLHCRHPRWKPPNLRAKDSKKIPYATHSYIPVTHRIRLWFSSVQRAAAMTSYRFEAEKNCDKGLCSDFWSSDLFQELKGKHLFQSDTDIGFMMSTDGVKVFKSRRSFSIWPLLLVGLLITKILAWSKWQNRLDKLEPSSKH